MTKCPRTLIRCTQVNRCSPWLDCTDKVTARNGPTLNDDDDDDDDDDEKEWDVLVVVAPVPFPEGLMVSVRLKVCSSPMASGSSPS